MSIFTCGRPLALMQALGLLSRASRSVRSSTQALASAPAGGSISAEHGIGQMKLAEFARLADPARLSTLRALKAAFDPLGIMNPGKLVP
jgi:FAD/FMN-containing dehydrogenase